jgi:hypothetical protein
VDLFVLCACWQLVCKSSFANQLTLHPPPGPARLAEGANALAARECDLASQRERLDAELAAARRAAEAAAEERSALQQRAALLDTEREQFRGWMHDAREEAARSIKVRHLAWARAPLSHTWE